MGDGQRYSCRCLKPNGWLAIQSLAQKISWHVRCLLVRSSILSWILSKAKHSMILSFRQGAETASGKREVSTYDGTSIFFVTPAPLRQKMCI